MKKLKRLIITEEMLGEIFIGNREFKIEGLPETAKVHHMYHSAINKEINIFYTDESFAIISETEKIPLIDVSFRERENRSEILVK